MSKLDEIINRYWDEVIRGDKLPLAMQDEFKDNVKILMLKLIGYGSVDFDYNIDDLSLSEKAEFVGRNTLTTELRQKINDL